VKIYQWKIFNAVAAYQISYLCIADSVRSGTAKERKVRPDVINAMNFPCQYIGNFPMAVCKKVILRAIPYWREVGTEKWIQDEEARYI
jgi:hypothetical protein